MVPATSLADLHDVDAELAIFPRHRLELLCRLDSPRVWPKLVTEDVGNVRQLLFAAHRAVSRCGFTVVLGGAQQVGIGVADVRRRCTALKQRSKRRSPLKRVVDVTALRPHACQSTRSWLSRTSRLDVLARRPRLVTRGRTSEGLFAFKSRVTLSLVVGTGCGHGPLV